MRRTAPGFTLIELVITIVILGILATVVMLNFGAKTQHGVITQANELRRNLSHIQLLAISQGNRLKLTVTQTGYSVYCAVVTPTCTSTATPITDPVTGAQFTVTLKDARFTAPATLYLDTLGRPVANATDTAPLTSPITAFTLEEPTGGGQTASVTVLPVTGFAQAS